MTQLSRSEVFDAFDHLADGIEIAVCRAAPGSAHAEPAGAAAFGFARRRQNRIDVHQGIAVGAGIVMRTLRTIGAIFGATAGLDRQKRANLDFVWRKILPVQGLGSKQ